MKGNQLAFAALCNEMGEGGAGSGAAKEDSGRAATTDTLVCQDAEDSSFANEVGEAKGGVLLGKKDEPPFFATALDDLVDQGVVERSIVGAHPDLVLGEKKSLGEEFPVSHVRNNEDDPSAFGCC